MLPLNIAAIEQEARKLRAEEIQRIEGLFLARMLVYGRSLLATAGAGLTVASIGLRRLFSWNPQAHRS